MTAANGIHRVLKDRRTKSLVRRLRPGDIALIHHADLDTTAARALVERHVTAVVNAAPSVTGRYPNRGPSVLLNAGIVVLDRLGEGAYAAIPDGARAFIEGSELVAVPGGRFTGELLTGDRLATQLEGARKNVEAELDRFARNTLDYLDREHGVLTEEVPVPVLRTRFDGKHVLIVVRGEGFKQDLAMLRDYLSDARPVLVAVDGGADALLEARLRPDVIIGDMDSVSDDALRCGAELVVHAYSITDGRGAPGLERLKRLGLDAAAFAVRGTSEDAAMILADELGGSLLVAVGTHFSLEEFLDKGRAGMASTFLTRLRIGSKLVDAKGISRLWARQRSHWPELGIVAVSALSTLVAVLLLSEAGKNVLRSISLLLRHGR